MDTQGSHCASGMKGCKCPCHKMMGIFIALIGLVILLGNTGVISASLAGTIWPILLILIGLKKSCLKGICKCCAKETTHS